MQQHGSKINILPADPPDPGDQGAIGQNTTLAGHGHVAYQIKENHKCSNMVANILPADPPLPLDPPNPDLEDGLNRSKFDFSEHGHVAYQIKWNHKFSNMVANISHSHPPPPEP